MQAQYVKHAIQPASSALISNSDLASDDQGEMLGVTEGGSRRSNTRELVSGEPRRIPTACR